MILFYTSVVERIEVKTPIYKEILIAAVVGICVIFCGVLIVLGFQERTWHIFAIGILGGGFFLSGLFFEMTSRIVLIADARGLFVHPYALAKKKQVSWRDIAGFEKAIQSTPSRGIGPQPKFTHLVIRMKRPEEKVPSTASAFFTQTFARLVIMNSPFIPGDIYIPAMRLPGQIDDLIVQLQAYQASMTASSEAEMSR